MPVRLMPVPSGASALPQQPGSRVHSFPPSRAREAFFTSFSRELRWSLDRAGRLALVDGAWQSVLGWQPQDLRGWYWEDLVHPGDHARVNDALRRLNADPDCEREIDLRLALRAGGYQPTSWTFVSGCGGDSVLGLGHDLPAPTRPNRNGAEQRNAELVLRLQELEGRYAAVEQFAATAAHQLAVPLVIAESSALLVAEELGDGLDPMLRGRLDAIGSAAARARRLMDSLLADARTTDRRRLSRRTVDVATIVEQVLTSLELQVEERSASIVVESLPQLHADPGLLSVVLENLISNALKYGPRSGGRIVITSEPCPTGQRVSVASEGMPIPREDAGQIFKPFHRAPGERRVPGVGLGLTICARLVERLGGTIGVEPGVASGNTFWIELPAIA
jgi:signal transduction histidine kinase